jgi:hypothetical protein
MPTANAISLTVIRLSPLISTLTSAPLSSIRDGKGQHVTSFSSDVIFSLSDLFTQFSTFSCHAMFIVLK